MNDTHAAPKPPREEALINPGGLNLLQLTMMVITSTICAGIFSLCGDLAAGGANTGAVLTGWAVCFIGVYTLMSVFRGLSQARPDLTGGIYAYAAAGFGDFIGFNSAWGYWISACFSNVSFAILLFGSLGYFFPVFGAGNNIVSFICASVAIWACSILVSRGVKEAVSLNTIVTIAKLVPLALFVVAIVVLGKFDPDTFLANFWGEAGGPDFWTQFVSTMIALVWVFTGIEGAVVISGKAKYVRDVGRATSLGFVSVFVLYLLISILSMGVVPREVMAELPAPSLAGILEAAIGPIGAGIVNLAVVLSLAGALIGYVVIAAETPYEAAVQGTFPKFFAKTNKRGAPVVTIFVSAAIMQLFLILAVASAGTYQFFYTCAVNTILIPYVCSAAYYMIIGWKNRHLESPLAPRRASVMIFGTLAFIYTLFLVYTTGLEGVMVTTVTFAPGLVVYAIGERGRGKKILPLAWDKIIAAAILILAVVSIYLQVTGIAPVA